MNKLDTIEEEKIIDTVTKFDYLFGQLWEISVDGMRLTDDKGIIVMVNEAYCKMVEMSKEELTGKPFSVVYHTSEQEKVLKTYRFDFMNNKIKTHFERENTLWNGKSDGSNFLICLLNLQTTRNIL